MGDRRRAIGVALRGRLDPLADHGAEAVETWLASAGAPQGRLLRFTLMSADPDDLTLRQARALALADRIFHTPDVPPALLDRARADAVRIVGAPPADPGSGLSVMLEMDR